jgi:hypothetical protein
MCYYHFSESGNNMRLVPLTYTTLYAELAQRALDASFTSDFSTEGRFITQESRGRRYWYFDTASGAAKKRLYVGPVDDPVISTRVDDFKHLKADVRARRKLVSTLVREAYLPRPEQKSGDVVQGLAEAGFFRLRGVLVGTVAYQCYPALLGVRLQDTTMQTADADFAQFHAISSEVEDSVEPILDKLRTIDPTFRPIPHQADGRYTTQLVSSDGYRVDFLTPNTGSDDHQGHPAHMPALGGLAAEPLRFLDFLIHLPERAVLLHGAGVSVLVPAPERFAVHKLIVATRRQAGNAKSNKDRAQAFNLMQAMVETRRTDALADAYMEAWDRGNAWQDAIVTSLRLIDLSGYAPIAEALRESILRLDGKPQRYGL